MAYVGVRAWPAGKAVSMRNGEGSIKLETAADVATFWSVFFADPYPVLPSDRFIVDAGANIGVFAFHAARMAPKAQIVAVEPFPSTFSRLEKLASAPWTGRRIRPVQAALAGRDGEGFIEAESSIGSQFRRMSVVSGKAQGLAVTAISLKSLMEQHGLEFIDVLKMDIEGSEYDVLLNAPLPLLQRVSRVYLEYHPQPTNPENTPESIIASLAAAGLKLTSHADHGDGYGILHFERAAAAG